MTDYQAATNTIRSRFKLLCEDRISAISDAVYYDNSPQPNTEPDDRIFCFLDFAMGESSQVQLGSNSAGDRHRYFGVMVAELYAPLETGTGELYSTADAISEVFRSRFIDGIVYGTPRVVNLGREDGRYRIDVNCPFRFDDGAVPVAIANFDPSSLGSLQNWWKANDAATLTLDVSNRISLWQDKAGNSNFVQSIDGNKPVLIPGSINGKNAIRLDSSSQHYMDTAAFTEDVNQIASVFVVCRATEASQIDLASFLSTDGTDDFQLDFLSDNIHISSTAELAGPAWGTSLNIIHLELGTNTRTLWVNGGASSDTDTTPFANDFTQWILGRNRGGAFYASGDVAEILVYYKSLSTSERNQVGQYLRGEWGGTWDLIS